MQGTIVPNIEDADLVLFTGGEDISPKLYGKKAHPATYFNAQRDSYEVEAFKYARELDKKLIGICRGAQLFCAMAGGILVQHQRHAWTHPMMTSDGNEILTNSLHHQRAYPWGGKKPRFELLAWASDGYRSPFSYGEDSDDDLSDKPDAEIVLYPDIKALAIQGHPEMAYPPDNEHELTFVAYCRQQLDKLMEM